MSIPTSFPISSIFFFYFFPFYSFPLFPVIDYVTTCCECSSTRYSQFTDFAQCYISCYHSALYNHWITHRIVSSRLVGDAFIFVFQCRRILYITKLEKTQKESELNLKEHIAEIRIKCRRVGINL